MFWGEIMKEQGLSRRDFLASLAVAGAREPRCLGAHGPRRLPIHWVAHRRDASMFITTCREVVPAAKGMIRSVPR